MDIKYFTEENVLKKNNQAEGRFLTGGGFLVKLRDQFKTICYSREYENCYLKMVTNFDNVEKIE